MASQRTLANPTVEVNDQVISIKPNSLSYKSGAGDTNVRSQSAGGNSIEVVVTENAETKIGMVKLMLLNTKFNHDLVDGWQGNTEGNTIRFSDGDFVKNARQMVVTTDPERSLGADGEIEIEFMGLPIT